MDLTGRPPRRSAMARWRAANSSCMGTSVVRPLAVAHGGYSSRRGEGTRGHWRHGGRRNRQRAERCAGGSIQPEQSDQLSAEGERSAVGSHQPTRRSGVADVRPPMLRQVTALPQNVPPDVDDLSPKSLREIIVLEHVFLALI